MSVGAWALLIFGACSFLSLLGSLWPAGRLSRDLRHGFFGKVFHILGSAVGFFIAAYTGTLLTASNQPLWRDSVWIAPLFLTSATSTGMAAILLLARARFAISAEYVTRLQHADLWAVLLELIVFFIFVASLGTFLLPVLHTWQGKVLVLGVPILGILLPLFLHARFGLLKRQSVVVAAACTLLGGFLLRYAVVATAPELLARGPEITALYSAKGSLGIGTPGPVLLPGFSPEDGRPRGGGPGADPGNRTPDLEPRSKVFDGSQ
jgi:formate-dependent nitrite reductase membrane component NrfD